MMYSRRDVLGAHGQAYPRKLIKPSPQIIARRDRGHTREQVGVPVHLQAEAVHNLFQVKIAVGHGLLTILSRMTACHSTGIMVTNQPR